MKCCLIYAGLVAVILGGDFGGAIPIAEAQVAVPPANPNGLTPQQMQRMRRMRLHRHHRHRRIGTTPAATSMIQNQMMPRQLMVNPVNGNKAAGNMTTQRKKQIAIQLRRASF